jgi:hypothetical protein
MKTGLIGLAMLIATIVWTIWAVGANTSIYFVFESRYWLAPWLAGTLLWVWLVRRVNWFCLFGALAVAFALGLTQSVGLQIATTTLYLLVSAIFLLVTGMSPDILKITCEVIETKETFTNGNSSVHLLVRTETGNTLALCGVCVPILHFVKKGSTLTLSYDSSTNIIHRVASDAFVDSEDVSTAIAGK